LVGLSFNNTPAAWGCANTTTGAIATAVFTGLANTTTIITDITTNSCGFGFAAQNCQASSSGAPTYLPSKDEMNWLWTNRVASGLILTGQFWSSTEVDATHAWYFDSTLATPAWVNTGLKTDQYNAATIWQF
jgi:hypothetical protein